jgi:hypothetical protein
VLSREVTHTHFIGVNRSGLEPTIYRTRVEHANHYTTDAVILLKESVRDGHQIPLVSTKETSTPHFKSQNTYKRSRYMSLAIQVSLIRGNNPGIIHLGETVRRIISIKFTNISLV